MKIKKSLAFLLSLAMILSCFPTISFAGDGLVGSDKGKIEFFYVKEEPGGPINGQYKEVPVEDIGTLQVDDTFYVGVRNKDFSNIREAVDGNKGISDIAFGLFYDSTYLKAEPDMSVVAPFTMNNKLQTRLGTNEGSIFHQLTDGTSYSLNSASDSETTSPWYTFQLGFVNNGSAYVTPAFHGLETLNFALIQFKVIKVPDNGATVFKLSTNPEATQLKFVTNGAEAGQYQYEDSSIAMSNILNVIDFDFSGVDIFPKSYTIDFYHTKDAAENETPDQKIKSITGIKAGKSLTDANEDGKMPKTTDYKPGDGQKKVYKGLKYLDKDDQEQPFDKDTKITADMFKDDDTTLKVYAEYEDAYEITFKPNYPDGTAGAPDEQKVLVPQSTGKLTGDAPAFAAPAGYAFKGWAEDGDGSTTISDIKEKQFTGDDDVFAVWTKQAVISLYPNDGTEDDGLGTAQTFMLDQSKNETIQSTGKSITEPSRNGYKFTGWNTKANGTGTDATTSTIETTQYSEATTYYAKWELDKSVVTNPDEQVTLSFDSVGGSDPNPKQIELKKDDKLYKDQITDDPTKKSTGGSNLDYTFNGWFKGAEISNTDKADFDNGYAVGETHTVYAHWSYEQDDAVTVTFHDNGAQPSLTPTSVKIGPGDSLGDAMPTDLKKDGKQFAGWYRDDTAFTQKVEKDTVISSSGGETVHLYAKYVDNIKITYDLNGHGSPKPSDVTGAPDATYTNPTEPTDDKYDFIEWNTEKNGSGTTITADVQSTLKDVSDAAGGATDITLYAQWGYVLGPYVSDGVVVKFNKNNNDVSGATEAKPNEKTVQQNSTLGNDNMPAPPERTNYDFDGWYPVPDGSGTEFTGTSTPIDYDQYFEQKTDNGNYNVLNLYAKWKLKDTVDAGDTVTLTFKVNKDGKGGTDGADKEIKIHKGDSLGYVPSAPENGDFTFKKWQTGNASSKSDVVDATGNDFAADKTFSENTDIYAKWELKVIIGPKSDNKDVAYTGEEIKDTKYIAYVAQSDGQTSTSKTYRDNIMFEPADTEFEITNYDYTEPTVGATPGSQSTKTEVRDAGTYEPDIDVKANSDAEAKGVIVSKVDPVLTVKQAQLAVKVDPDTQIQKKKAATGATITFEGWKGDDITTAQNSASSLYEIKYYKWTDDGAKDNEIQETELALDTSHNTPGYYVIKIEMKTKNYEEVVPVASAGSLHTYLDAAAADNKTPVYKDAAKVVYYQVLNDDPSPNGITVKSVDKEGAETDAKLTQSDYSTDKPFSKDDTTDYYTRVPEGTENLEVTFTMPDDFDGKAYVVDGDGTPHEATKQADGTYQATVPVTETAPKLNDWTLKTETSDKSETKEYPLHVQKLAKPAISSFTPGNSPYGLIEAMKGKGWDDDKIAQAKTSFNDKSGPTASDDNTFKAGDYLPDGATVGVPFYPVAWTEQQTPHNPTQDELIKIEDPTINLDRNPNAIFVYNGKTFHDPGFELKDSEGKTVQAKDVKIKIENVKIMRVHGTANAKDAVLLDEQTIETTGDAVIDLTDISTGTADTHQIRPGVYYMTYTFYDDATGQDVTVDEKRPVVILWELGDADISTIINGSDSTFISSYVNKAEKPTEGIADEKMHKLLLYRIMDADRSGIVNGSDATKISSHVSKADKIVPFYTILN